MTLLARRIANVTPNVFAPYGTMGGVCGDLDRAAAQFIPMLAPGEAIIIGTDLPTPLPLRIAWPKSPPDSKGPQFHSHWADRINQRLVADLL